MVASLPRLKADWRRFDDRYWAGSRLPAPGGADADSGHLIVNGRPVVVSMASKEGLPSHQWFLHQLKQQGQEQRYE